jgi:hypothetical protein
MQFNGAIMSFDPIGLTSCIRRKANDKGVVSLTTGKDCMPNNIGKTENIMSSWGQQMPPHPSNGRLSRMFIQAVNLQEL